MDIIYYIVKIKKVAEIALPSFVSILFGISEPAIFGVNLKHKFPLVAGCIAGAIAGAFFGYILCAILVGQLVGFIVLVLIALGGYGASRVMQTHGLHSKPRSKDIYVVKTLFTRQ